MLLVHPVKEVIRFLPAVIGLLVAGSTRNGGQQWWWGLLGAGAAVALGLLRWFTTRYRFTPDQVLLRHGLFSRTTVTAPADRVRTVDVTSSILHRALGLAEVKIGTGAESADLNLDGLTRKQAADLRYELLHRRRGVQAAPAGMPPGTAPADRLDPGVLEGSEEEILRLNPSWIRFAPFGPSGLIAAAAIFGVGAQVLNESGFDFENNGTVQRGLDEAERLGVWVAILIAVIGIALLSVLLSLGGYLLLYWGFRLTRHAEGGTLHITRGLLTTRATTLEERRLRGVELHQPLPLRLVGGARLKAITTGFKDEDKAQSSMLVPPAPLPVARDVADRVLHAPGTLDAPLVGHGAAATRRRYTRALTGAAVLAAAIGIGGYLLEPALAILAVVPLLIAPLLAADRAKALAHGLTDRYLLSRSGSVVRTTNVLERSGAIGVTLRRSFFQRRVGLTSVHVVSAAGDKSYAVTDVPDGAAISLADDVLDGHLAAFRA